jgi:hypothetical protein
MWITIQWAQVTAGVGFALLGEPGRFLRFSSLRNFLAYSECTLEKANTLTVCRRVYDRTLTQNAVAGCYTIGDIYAINHDHLLSLH